MPYDVAFRHQQALDPSALVTIGASLHAITRAIDDCRNAGIAFETDPAVILLARHLARVTPRHYAAARPEVIATTADAAVDDLAVGHGAVER